MGKSQKEDLVILLNTFSEQPAGQYTEEDDRGSIYRAVSVLWSQAKCELTSEACKRRRNIYMNEPNLDLVVSEAAIFERYTKLVQKYMVESHRPRERNRELGGVILNKPRGDY